MRGNGQRARKRAPEGALIEAGDEWGLGDAEAGGGEGGEHADDQEGQGGETVGGLFEGLEGHDTHLRSLGWNPGGAGLSVWTLFR